MCPQELQKDLQQAVTAGTTSDTATDPGRFWGDFVQLESLTEKLKGPAWVKRCGDAKGVSLVKSDHVYSIV